MLHGFYFARAVIVLASSLNLEGLLVCLKEKHEPTPPLMGVA